MVDTSALLAYFDRNKPMHRAVADVIDDDNGVLVVSPFVVAELDCLIATRHGAQAELAARTELAGGSWELPGVGVHDLRRSDEVVERYGDQDIGVVDASNVVLAEPCRTREIATLDRRHFDVLRPIQGGVFSLVP